MTEIEDLIRRFNTHPWFPEEGRTAVLMIGLAVYTATFTIDVLAFWFWIMAALVVCRGRDIGMDANARLRSNGLAEEEQGGNPELLQTSSGPG